MQFDCLTLTFKTLWNFNLPIEKVKMSWDCVKRCWSCFLLKFTIHDCYYDDNYVARWYEGKGNFIFIMISAREGQFYVQWQRLVSLVGKLPFLVNQNFQDVYVKEIILERRMLFIEMFPINSTGQSCYAGFICRRCWAGFYYIRIYL